MLWKGFLRQKNHFKDEPDTPVNHSWFGAKEYLTMISRARVGCEMINSQRGAWHRVGSNPLISKKDKWNNCFIKNNQEILLDLSDFALQEQPEYNLMVAISPAW